MVKCGGKFSTFTMKCKRLDNLNGGAIVFHYDNSNTN